MKGPWPTGGCRAIKKNIFLIESCILQCDAVSTGNYYRRFESIGSVFRVKQSKHCLTLKMKTVHSCETSVTVTSWYSVTLQKHLIFSSTAARTSNDRTSLLWRFRNELIFQCVPQGPSWNSQVLRNSGLGPAIPTTFSSLSAYAVSTCFSVLNDDISSST
jgi:hypothetical protein